MSNKKIKPEIKNKRQEIPAQKLFDFTISAVREIIASELMPLKRENQDLKITQKLLLRRIMNLELDYKALGISIGNLGIAELQLLNETSNRIKQKLSVMDSKGGIQGRINTHRFNLIPSNKNLMVEISNKVNEEENGLKQ